jgi:hypothetical protein
MSAHTPGPWNVSSPCELSPRYSVYHNGPLVYVERGEDARLIAAAPDLLVALQDLLSATEETYDNRHERQAALDAIIKATEGETA